MNVWWVINEDILMHSLERVANGEDPHVMFMELVANSTMEKK